MYSIFYFRVWPEQSQAKEQNEDPNDDL